MKQNQLTRLLVKPSTSSLLGAIGSALLVMFMSGFSFVTRNGLFYDYLFGEGSSTELIESSRSTIALFNETVFGNPALNKILFFVFWMVIGLVVYVIISGIGSGVSTAEHTIEESRFVHAQKLKMGSELGLKVVLHTIGLGLMVIFLIFLFKILLPFGVLCARILAADAKGALNWLYGLLGFVVLATSFYLGIILLRFLTLRPRLFGGWEDLISDEIEHSTHSAN